MRVAVLGAGYAGVTAVRLLERRLPGDDRSAPGEFEWIDGGAREGNGEADPAGEPADAAGDPADATPEDVELVLVDERDHHVVQHELHRVIRRPSLADDISIPLPDLLDRAEFRQARVTDVDVEAGVAHLTEPDPPAGGDPGSFGADAGTDPGAGTGSDGDPAGDGEDGGRDVANAGTGDDPDAEAAGAGDPGAPDASEDAASADDPDRVTVVEGEERLAFDAGVVCLGAETAFYGIPGLREHATPLKRLEHARAIREEFLDVVAPGEGGRVVVGGAGLSGVQVAGELAALSREEGVAAGTEVVLLEQEDRVAPTLPAKFSEAVRDELEARGVEVRTGHTVARATDDAVETDRGEVAHDQLVWTGGIAGGDPMAGDRPVVNRHLRLGPRTFGAGDAVRAVDADGEAAPAAAQSAVRQAPVAADNVVRLVEHDLGLDGGAFEPRLKSYRHDSPGWLVSVGDGAVAQVGPAVFTGFTAKAMKTTVGAGYLTSVGSIRRAVDLVNEELGIAGAVRSDPDVDVDVVEE